MDKGQFFNLNHIIPMIIVDNLHYHLFLSVMWLQQPLTGTFVLDWILQNTLLCHSLKVGSLV